MMVNYGDVFQRKLYANSSCIFSSADIRYTNFPSYLSTLKRQGKKNSLGASAVNNLGLTLNQ